MGNFGQPDLLLLNDGTGGFADTRELPGSGSSETQCMALFDLDPQY